MEHDQCIFNRVSYEISANGRCLPLEKFPYGKLYFEVMPSNVKEKVVIIHNNWIQGKSMKIQRFMDHNLWAENGSLCKEGNIEKNIFGR